MKKNVTNAVPFLSRGPKTYFLTSAERQRLRPIKGNADEMQKQVVREEGIDGYPVFLFILLATRSVWTDRTGDKQVTVKPAGGQRKGGDRILMRECAHF